MTSAVTGAVHLSSRRSTLAAAAGAVAGRGPRAATSGPVGHLLDADAAWTALAGLLVLGARCWARRTCRGRWWAAERPGARPHRPRGRRGRAALPLGAGRACCCATDATDATWTAVLPHRRRRRGDRDVPAPRATGARSAGSAARCSRWRAGCGCGTSACTEPEAYTLPSAIALLVVGVLHLRRDPGAEHDDRAGARALAGPGAEPAVGARRARPGCGRCCSAWPAWRWCWPACGCAGPRRSCSARRSAPCWCCGWRRRTSATRCRAGCCIGGAGRAADRDGRHLGAPARTRRGT